MGIRTISGACFVVIVTAFFLLRQFVSPIIFAVLVWLLATVATFEMARALKKYSMKGSFVVSVIYGFLFVPLYCFCQYFTVKGYGYFISLLFTLCFIIGLGIYAIAKNYGFKTYCISVLPTIYPMLLLLSMLCCNDIAGQKGFIALLLIFIISPFADTFAYLVGMTYSKIRHGNVKKMCPKLSPKKTWAGAIGGVIGGAVGSILVCLIFAKAQISFNPQIVFYLIVGLIGSVVTEIGDLLESLVKRKVGIKDMGKIMPGHGGVMDRIDGISLASLFIFVMFSVV